MKAFVDKDTCTGCGLCENACPEVFKINDDGVAEAIAEDIPESLVKTAKEACEDCPVEAITIK